jgi:hypothetical protein
VQKAVLENCDRTAVLSPKLVHTAIKQY